MNGKDISMGGKPVGLSIGMIEYLDFNGPEKRHPWC